MNISTIMSHNPITARKSDSLKDAMALMSSKAVEHLPITTDLNELCGIVSKNDIYNKLIDEFRTKNDHLKPIDLTKIQVKDIMTKDPIYVNSDDPLEYATELLLQGYFHAIPVLKDGCLHGILTSMDILKFHSNIRMKRFAF